MTAEALLRHDRNGVARGALEGIENLVPDVSFVRLVRLSASAVNRKDTDIVTCQAVNCESATERGNMRVGTSQHAIDSERILFLLFGFTLDLSDARRDVLVVNRLALGFAPFR